MTFKRFLDDLLLQKAPGPQPSFTVLDVMKVLELIAEIRGIGRGKLSEELKIGGGAIRTLINRLKDAGLITISRSGCALTKKGESLWDEIKSILPQKVILEKNELTFAAHNVALLVKGRGDSVKNGIEQRDAAVKVGAKGATTLVFKNNKLTLPNVSADLSRDFPVSFKQITNIMSLKENDVVVIGSADKPKEAEYGALAAAWSII